MNTPVDAGTLVRIREHVLAVLRERFHGVETLDVEDALQDALERWCLRAPPAVRMSEIDSIRWILTVASRALIDALRHNKFNTPLTNEFEWLTDGRSIADDVETHDLLEFAMGKLGRRSFQQITTIVYHDQYGRSFENIAANLHCSVGAAMMHHTRAKAFLRRIISDEATK